MPYADGAFSMPSSFAQLTRRMNGEKDKKRYEAKKPPRLVKYWLLVFEMGFKLGLRLGIAMSMGASDS